MDRQKPVILADSLLSASFTAKKVTIDGKIDEIWKTARVYKCENTILGNVNGAEDLSAQLRCLWDNENLYFLVEITDDSQVYKAYKKLFCDYGWLENERGGKAWQMNYKNTEPAGGAQKNVRADTTLLLPPGKYILRYVSDENHAYNAWDDTAPNFPLYGISVSKAKRSPRASTEK